MPDIPIVTIESIQFNTKKQKKLMDMLADKQVQKEVNIRTKDAINHFVPKDTGALRRSAQVTYNMISWGAGLAQYARYQYYGNIYGKNYPIVRNGKIVGWFSKPGVKKFPTGRQISAYHYGNELMGYPFGYTEPGTQHHWDEKYKKSLIWKARANIEITRYLKKECKRRGLKV